MNASAYGFLAGLGQKISAISGDDRETCYMFQRISEQNVQTSRTQRPGGSRLCVGGNRPTCGQRTSGSLQGRQQTGKRPDGLMMVHWREGKPLTWDVTVVCPLAESYIGDSATNAGSAAEAAATR